MIVLAVVNFKGGSSKWGLGHDHRPTASFAQVTPLTAPFRVSRSYLYKALSEAEGLAALVTADDRSGAVDTVREGGAS